MGNFLDFFRDKTLLPMGGRADTITTSGFSSGSIMSANIHVIHSDLFKGAGLMAGSAYWTGELYTNNEEYNATSTAE
jgi:predicted esterase